ncbi:MAG: PIN domain-containing protein [Candidatus Bathyarchaeia archaeon]
MRIVIDTYAWIEFFLGSGKGEIVGEIFRKAEEMYTPDVVLAELARKYLKEGVAERRILERIGMIEDSSEVIFIDGSVAVEAAKCYFELLDRAKVRGINAPSLFDAIILATARVFNARVVTGDEHFKELEETLWMGDV